MAAKPEDGADDGDPIRTGGNCRVPTLARLSFRDESDESDDADAGGDAVLLCRR
jgi:hypothetical protein